MRANLEGLHGRHIARALATAPTSLLSEDFSLNEESEVQRHAFARLVQQHPPTSTHCCTLTITLISAQHPQHVWAVHAGVQEVMSAKAEEKKQLSTATNGNLPWKRRGGATAAGYLSRSLL